MKILLIILITLLLITTACKDDTPPETPPIEPQCGDNECTLQEKKSNSCPEDCGEDKKQEGLLERKYALLEKFNGEFIENLEYATTDEKDLLLDLYIPEITEKTPLIIWIHGGGWTSGSKDSVADSAIQIAEHNYIVAAVEHRFSQEEIFPAQIHDIKAAVRWLRANADEYNIDENNIGVIGSSSGGHLASLLGTSGGELEGEVGNNLDQSSAVQAVVDLFGPVNLAELTQDCENICVLNHDEPTSPESNFLGCTLPDCLDKAEEASATTYITADDPPFLIFHGDQDPTISILQSENFHNDLLAAGIDSTFITAEGYDHDKRIANDYIEEIIEFYDEHLK